MLPSMPILFTRESQDAFGNKIEPSTSFFNQNQFDKPGINTGPPPSAAVPESSNASAKDLKEKENSNKNDQGNEDKAKSDENALETGKHEWALVRSYYTKVQSKFSTHMNLPTNKFVQFQGILKSFDPNKETPVDLYRKIEQLFGADHKDLVEEFLLFLKPGQAAEVGRVMDYFVMVQMTTFIELLQTTFARKPTVLRKVLRALTTGINTGSSKEMKHRILPHLRSNPRLTQMFKSLFPDERPADSSYEEKTDMINETFLTADEGYDVWEFEETNDNRRNIEAKDRLDTMYLHGRVFLQHGRMLRSARVTYPYSKEPYRVHCRRLAPNQAHLSPSESEEERSSPKRQNKNPSKIPPKRTKKQLKSPTKTAKDVNDNTNSCVTSSPKTTRKQSNAKTKSSKDKKDDIKSDVQKKEKKERTDSKTHSISKKEDGVKAKQAKIGANSGKMKVVEPNNVAIKVEPGNEEKAQDTNIESKVDTKKPKRPETKSNWTRDEDKTMLQVLKGEALSEQVFGRISELLPHRSVTEIKERFCHVMNLLQQMGVSHVT